jgi:hypothetical protein
VNLEQVLCGLREQFERSGKFGVFINLCAAHFVARMSLAAPVLSTS